MLRSCGKWNSGAVDDGLTHLKSGNQLTEEVEADGFPLSGRAKGKKGKSRLKWPLVCSAAMMLCGDVLGLVNARSIPCPSPLHVPIEGPLV
jgi:hypothetical protein